MITKALTFRAASIGDCLMGKYMLDNIHAHYPDARLGIVVSTRAGMIRDLLSAYPYIEVIEANRRSPQSLWRLWRRWRGSDVVVTQYAGKAGGRFGAASKLFARLLGTTLVGFTDTAWFNKFLYDILLPFDPAVSPAEHERRALRAAGFEVPLPYPVLQVSPGQGALAAFGVEAGRYAVVHLFSGSTKRGLSADKKRALIAALRTALPNLQLLVTGGTADKAEAEHAAAGSGARVIAGEASLVHMQELVAHSALVVSLDTGMAHIAAQLGRPLVVLSTCLGLFWWGSDQYGAGVPAALVTNPVHTEAGHAYVDYPECLDVSVEVVAKRVADIVRV
jgi:ADP-heptose:LPS heptosyltransferase